MKFIDLENISDLRTGDIVINKSATEAYVITNNYTTRATGVRTIDITNADEWQVLNIKERE